MFLQQHPFGTDEDLWLLLAQVNLCAIELEGPLPVSMTGLFSVPNSQIWNWSGNSQGLKTLLMGQGKVSEKNKASGIWFLCAIEKAIPKSEHVQESQTELNKADLLKLLSKSPTF